MKNSGNQKIFLSYSECINLTLMAILILCTKNIGMSQTISLLKNYNFDIQISLRKIKIEFVYSKKQPGRYGCFLN